METIKGIFIWVVALITLFVYFYFELYKLTGFGEVYADHPLELTKTIVKQGVVFLGVFAVVSLVVLMFVTLLLLVNEKTRKKIKESRDNDSNLIN